MARERYQTRLDPDIAERVDEYAENRGISEAEALRRLIRTGIDTADLDDTDSDRGPVVEAGVIGGSVLDAVLTIVLAAIFGYIGLVGLRTGEIAILFVAVAGAVLSAFIPVLYSRFSGDRDG